MKDSQRQVPVVVATSRDREVKFWSEGAELLYGVSADNALGQNLSDIARWRLSAADTATCDGGAVGEVWAFGHEAASRTGRKYLLRTTATVGIDNSSDDELVFYSIPVNAAKVLDGGRTVHYAPVGLHSELSVHCSSGMVVECTAASVPKVFGYLQRDIIGHRSLEFVHADDRRAWLRAWDAALSDVEHAHPVEVRARCADGDWRVISAELTNRLADPAISAVVIDCEDVTELRAASAEATAAKRALDLVLGGSVDGAWILDARYRTIFANASMANLLGVNRVSVADEPMGDAWVALFDRIIDRQHPGTRTNFRLPVRRADGDVRWLYVEAVPYHDQQARFTGCTLLCTNVPERKTSPVSTVRAIGARAEPDPDVELAGYGFSQRETDVVAKLLRGHRVPAIAEALFVSQSTVRSQLAAVFRKAGVNSQQELIDRLSGRST